ncbi:MAG: hypothetical protein GC204_01035 [Chloroflexi bacterium]|nr:hypothetical protein [Chloroflexota bacterium]
MFPGEDLLQEGITAFQAGDRAKARELLLEVVKIDPENEQAWYYLAASESDPTLRKQYLKTVLEINPGNAKAREVLDRIEARETVAEAAPAAAPSSTGTAKSRIRALDPTMETPPGAADEGPGAFKIPIKIAGAPEQTTWENLARDGVALLRIGLDVVMRKPGVYAEEVERATWWRFWLISGIAAVAGAVLSIFTALFLLVRFGTSLLGIIAILLTPFFFVAISLLTLYVGCYASYRYALTRGGNASLVKHAYTVALVWAPIALLSSVLGLIVNLFGFGGGAIISLLLFIYEVVVISDGFQSLHVFSDSNQKWITSVVMIVTMAVVSVLLSIIFGGFIVAGAMPL